MAGSILLDPNITDFNDTPAWQKVQELTNVTIQQSWKGPYAQVAPAEAAGIDVDQVRTLDDYHNLLEVYRDAGLERPFHMYPDGFDPALLAAYNLGGSGFISPFITIDGKIQYSFTMDEYYDYLTTAHSWYDERLIEPEFFGTVGDVAWDMDLMSSGSYGITSAAATVAQMLTDMSGKEYRAILAPVLHSGDTRKIAQIGGTSARVETAVTSVTTACHDVEAAVKYLDYFYSDDMFYLANYGIEGQTYTLDEAGQPQYTDLFLNDTEHNWTAKSQYYALWGSAGFLYAWDAQKAGMPGSVLYAYDLWDQNFEDERTLPSLSLTASEMETYSSRYSDIQTYVAESAVKFISGMEPLTPESYAAYVQHIQSMSIQECIDVYQAAYDRYLAR